MRRLFVFVVAALLALVSATLPANGRTSRAQEFTRNADGAPDFGTPVALGTSLPGPSGETAATAASYTLVNRDSGKCLDVNGGNIADGAGIRQSSWPDNDCQQRKLVPTT